MNQNILEEVLSHSPEIPLYHYTHQAGLMGIVRNVEILATHTQYLNDLREYLHALDMVRTQIRAIRDFGCDPNLSSILDDMENGLVDAEKLNICVCSFSEERDSLSQWRAYGARSSSFSIGFSGNFIREVAEREGWFLAPCIYDPKVQSKLVRALVDRVITENVFSRQSGITRTVSITCKQSGTITPVPLPPSGNLNIYLHRYAPILKHYSFREEREWRLISPPLSNRLEAFDFREGNSTLIPYYKLSLGTESLDLSLCEIVIGPTPYPQQSSASVRSFLVRQSQTGIPVSASQVPYRSW